MINRRIQDIKRAQKESFLFREVSTHLAQLFAENKDLNSMVPTRVKLSPDKGRCTIFFTVPGGEQEFKEKLQTLILYKPSLRSALAKSMQSRYTPDITFKYDAVLEKARHIDDLLDSLKEDK